jgi:aminoglycoside phosphotransferase (APT) family kinase protein
MNGPAAAGVRVAWQALPAAVRAAVEEICGAPVTEARTQPGGFSPGVAARLRCADGSRYFVKAVSAEANPDSPRFHRREGQNLAALDPVIVASSLPVPRLRGMAELGPWVALVLDDVDGRPPRLPWSDGDLRQVLAALDRLAGMLTPAPIPVRPIAEMYASTFSGWRKLARSPARDRLDPWSRAHLDELAALEPAWAAHSAGDTLLHTDVRADNLLLTADGEVVVVDWPHACRGSAFVELVLFAPSVAMQGGPQLADLLAMSPAGRRAPRQDVAAVLCALAGYFTHQALQPPPPGLPTVRAFQAAQGEVARRWLAGFL